MSELEHYKDDFSAIDREILRAALVAGIDLNDERALAALLATEPEHVDHSEPRDRARERLRGLLILRTKLETELLRDRL